MKRRQLNQATKDALIKKFGNSCAACGAENVPLDIHHILPISSGGTDDEENLTLLCHICNYRMSTMRLTEVEFNNYLSLLIENSGEFQDVKLEERLSRQTPYRADIIAKTNDNKTLLIECKNSSSFTSDRLQQAINQVQRYKSLSKFDSYILAFPGLLSEDQIKQIKKEGIDIWDVDVISRKFKEQIEKTRHPIFKNMFAMFSSRTKKTIEEKLIEKLKSCDKGRCSWFDYQKLIGQVLEHLFCPPLESPISESADYDEINRRDLILPNYADSGFWHFVRTTYHAHFVVVDAKNYKGSISKGQVLQIANYLKQHGAGLFALIITRVGADKGALLTIREQWVANQKLILVLNDYDIEAMLLAKSVGDDPSKIIGQLIQKFRLSM